VADQREDTITFISGQINVLEGLDKNIKEMTFTEIVKNNK
jgi:hypothetical protein